MLILGKHHVYTDPLNILIKRIKKNKRILFLGIFIFFISTILYYTNLSADQKKYGGTLLWGTTNPPTIINPILTSQGVSSAILDLIFDPLVHIDSKGNIAPGLAKFWKISKNELIYTFYLHEGVKFHDGVELTAEDVKFTYELINNPKTKSHWKTNTESIKKLEALDKYTIQITLKHPFPSLLYKLTREIVPKHLLNGKDLWNTKFNYHPIGTGPFKFKRWRKVQSKFSFFKQDQIELKANLKYFEGRPYLNKILIKTYPTTNTLWDALNKGDINLAKFLTVDQYEVAKRIPRLKTYKMISGMYYAMAYNTEYLILSNKKIRKAVSGVIDKQYIIDNVFYGNAIATNSPFHPSSIGFDPDVKPLVFDLDFSKEGWIPIHNGHTWEKNGEKLTINLLVNEKDATIKNLARNISLHLFSSAGIRTNFHFYTDESTLTKTYLKQNNIHAWLRYYMGMTFGKNDDMFASLKSWYSKSTEPGRLWEYKNKRLDELFELGLQTKNNSERKKIYQEANKIIYEDQPAAFLVYPASYHVVASKFKNTDPFFTSNMPGYQFKEWYIEN